MRRGPGPDFIGIELGGGGGGDEGSRGVRTTTSVVFTQDTYLDSGTGARQVILDNSVDSRTNDTRNPKDFIRADRSGVARLTTVEVDSNFFLDTGSGGYFVLLSEGC